MDIKVHYEPPAEVTLVKLGASTEDLATVTRGYSQIYEPTISSDEVDKFLEDLSNTKLKTPGAFVGMIWLLKNVTRNFEQQLTRYRVGTAFVCESLRFSDKRQAEFYCSAKTNLGRVHFQVACEDALLAYETILGDGEAVQDARGVLPSSICTHLFFYCNLQTLQHIYEQRACCQAQQEEWLSVLNQMISLLEYEGFHAYRKMLKAPWENPLCVDCGFRASFDRSCTRQHLFDDNLRKLADERLCNEEVIE